MERSERSNNQQRTVGIIATIAAVVLCGLPGLCGLLFGAIFSIAGAVPGAEIDVFGSEDPAAALTFGIVTLCLSVIAIAIPVIVGFATLRKGRTPAGEAVIESTPFAPAREEESPAEPPAPSEPEFGEEDKEDQDEEIPPAI